jgi:hypothetical protein
VSRELFDRVEAAFAAECERRGLGEPPVDSHVMLQAINTAGQTIAESTANIEPAWLPWLAPLFAAWASALDADEDAGTRPDRTAGVHPATAIVRLRAALDTLPRTLDTLARIPTADGSVPVYRADLEAVIAAAGAKTDTANVTPIRRRSR